MQNQRATRGGPAPDCHELTLLGSMESFLGALKADLPRARERVWVETYIVKDDPFGHELGRWLRAAAARGADVRLLYDPSGSHEAHVEYFEELEAGGVKVRPYGRGAFLGVLRPGLRDHSRLFILDDLAYTGGHAFARPWLPRSQGGDGWHDVCIRVDGPAARDMADFFARRWEEAPRAPAADLDTGDRYEDVRVVSEGPRGHDLIEIAHVEAFDGARRRIWMENAYFFPTLRLRDALFRAARRGVDVRVLVPGENDLPLIGRAAWAEYGHWLERGLALYEYEPSVMHAKCAVVDEALGFVGSYNANASATRMALDTVVIARQPGFVAALAAQLERDLGKSRRITPEIVRGRSFWDRERDGLAHAVMSLLDLAIGR